jgi:hypothetical protein
MRKPCISPSPHLPPVAGGIDRSRNARTSHPKHPPKPHSYPSVTFVVQAHLPPPLPAPQTPPLCAPTPSHGHSSQRPASSQVASPNTPPCLTKPNSAPPPRISIAPAHSSSSPKWMAKNPPPISATTPSSSPPDLTPLNLRPKIPPMGRNPANSSPSSAGNSPRPLPPSTRTSPHRRTRSRLPLSLGTPNGKPLGMHLDRGSHSRRPSRLRSATTHCPQMEGPLQK